MCLIFGWTNTSGWSAGAQKGALIGLLMGLTIDLSSYAMGTIYNDFKVIAVDISANIVMNTILGAVIGWFMGRGEKASA
jgi:hypothetical protein